MANDQPFDITSDSDLEAAVRAETGYDTDRLSGPDLADLVESAKRLLALRADVTDFYDDRGLAVALLGVTCIKAKAQVENQPVRAENIGAGDTTFRATDGDSLQVTEYEDMVQRGLSNSTETDEGVAEIYLTNTYFHD